MEHKINKLDIKTVKNELRLRLERYEYRLFLMEKAMPIIERYQGKKVTKHITNALNKELGEYCLETDFNGVYLDGVLDKLDSIRFRQTKAKCKWSGKLLNDHYNTFTIELASIKWPEKTGVVDKDVKNFKYNNIYTNPKLIHRTRCEYIRAVDDCERMVKKNNELYEKIQKLHKEIDENHSANRYAFR